MWCERIHAIAAQMQAYLFLRSWRKMNNLWYVWIALSTSIDEIEWKGKRGKDKDSNREERPWYISRNRSCRRSKRWWESKCLVTAVRFFFFFSILPKVISSLLFFSYRVIVDSIKIGIQANHSAIVACWKKKQSTLIGGITPIKILHHIPSSQ